MVPLPEITMCIARRSHLTDIDGFPDGPIGRYVSAFKYLSQRRYAAKTVATYLSALHHAFRAMGALRTPSRQRIDEVLIGEFLDEHLPQCECAGSIRNERSVAGGGRCQDSPVSGTRHVDSIAADTTCWLVRCGER